MAKSKVLKELANDEISISVALRRLMIISYELNNEELNGWIEKELNGYKANDEPPSYRAINSACLRYSGINGAFQVTNQPLPMGYLDKEMRKEINPVYAFESISALMELSKDKGKPLVRDLTFLAGQVFKNTGGIRCTKIEQVIANTEYIAILDNIKTILMKIFIKLEKQFGNLDDFDIDISQTSEESIKLLNISIVNLIYDGSINIGDGNDISKSTIGG